MINDIEDAKKDAEKIISTYNKESVDIYKKYRKVVDEYNIFLEVFFDTKLHLKTNKQMEEIKPE